MQTEIDPDLELVKPTTEQQALIMGLTDVLYEVLSEFPPQVASSAIVAVTLQRFITGPIEDRRARVADIQMLARILEDIGDAQGDEAWQHVRQSLPENTFNQDQPAGATLQ